METFRPPVFEYRPASVPRYTLSIPLVTHLPAQEPKNKLKQPADPSRLHPEQVLPANKFRSASASNPPEGRLVKQEPSPQNLVASTTPVDAVTVAIPATVTL